MEDLAFNIQNLQNLRCMRSTSLDLENPLVSHPYDRIDPTKASKSRQVVFGCNLYARSFNNNMLSAFRPLPERDFLFNVN